MSLIRIGISGWRYEPWRGIFYPQGLPQRAELEYAAQRFATIELNGSHYSLQTPASYAQWYAQTPDDFVFAIKGSRYITHLLRLGEIERPLANFFAQGLLRLRHKLGPILWQFPAHMHFNAERFERFFRLLPHSTAAALALARRRDARMHGRSSLAIDQDRPLRHAVEIRHASFACREFVELLRAHGIALVFADTAGKWPYFEDLTADFAYLRLHGDVELYTSGYSEAALQRWAARIRAWSAGRTPDDARIVAPPAPVAPRDIYCYFDNDVKVRAPYDARTLARLLGMAEGLPPLAPFREPVDPVGALGPRARPRAPDFQWKGIGRAPKPRRLSSKPSASSPTRAR